MTTTAARKLDARRDYYREYLDHGVHDVPRSARRQIVDLLSASFIAQVHGDLRGAGAKLRAAEKIGREHGLTIAR